MPGDVHYAEHPYTAPAARQPAGAAYPMWELSHERYVRVQSERRLA